MSCMVSPASATASVAAAMLMPMSVMSGSSPRCVCATPEITACVIVDLLPSGLP